MRDIKPTRILFLHSDLDVGGAQRMRFTVLKKIDRSKYGITICCINRKGWFGERLEEIGFKVDVLGLSDKMHNLLTTFKLFRYIRKNRFHIVHSSLFHANFHARIAARLAGVPIVISEEHGECYHFKGIKFAPYIFADRTLAAFTDKIICCSANTKDALVKIEKICPGKISVILNAVLEESLMVRSQRDEVKKELGIPDDHAVIGTIGTLSVYKAQDVLARAFKEVLKARPKSSLLIVGDGPLREDLKRYVQGLGLSGNVVFAGQRLDVADMLNAMDVFVLSSMSEGFPISLLEAMYMGIPSIVPDKGGISEIVENGKSGYLFSYPDHNDLANAAINLLTNAGAAQKIGRASKDKVFSNFLSARYVSQLEAIYGDLLEKKEIQINRLKT